MRAQREHGHRCVCANAAGHRCAHTRKLRCPSSRGAQPVGAARYPPGTQGRLHTALSSLSFLFFFFLSCCCKIHSRFSIVQVKPDMDSKPATNHGVKPLGWHLGAPGTGLGTAPRARAAWCVCALLISPLAQLFSPSELCSAPPALQHAAVALPEGGTAWDLPGCRHPIPQGHTHRDGFMHPVHPLPELPLNKTIPAPAGGNLVPESGRALSSPHPPVLKGPARQRSAAGARRAHGAAL